MKKSNNLSIEKQSHMSGDNVVVGKTRNNTSPSNFPAPLNGCQFEDVALK